jgi:hypothetical protein
MLKDGVSVTMHVLAANSTGGVDRKTNKGNTKVELLSIGIRTTVQLKMGDGCNLQPGLAAKSAGAIQDAGTHIRGRMLGSNPISHMIAHCETFLHVEGGGSGGNQKRIEREVSRIKQSVNGNGGR